MEDVLKQLKFAPNEAAIFLGHSRYMLIRPETLIALSEAIGDDAGDCFFAAGRAGGRMAGKGYFEKQGRDPQGAIRLLTEMGGVLGWAVMNLVTYEEGRYFKIEAKSSSLNWKDGAGWRLLAGILVGLGEIIFNGPVQVEQEPRPGAPQAGMRYTVRSSED